MKIFSSAWIACIGINAITSVSAFCAYGSVDSTTCIITGTVIDRPKTKSAMIVEANKDFRIHPPVNVPVVDGKFSYIIHDTVPRAYQVIFDDERATWQNRYFFTGEGNIELFYHNEEKVDDDLIVSDISDNILAEKFSDMEKAEIKVERDSLYALIDSLYENNAVHSPDIQALYDKLNNMPQGHERDSVMDVVGRRFMESRQNSYAHSKFYSKEYLEYEKELNELFYKADTMKRNFISENPSLYGLFSIKDAIMYAVDANGRIDIPAYEDIFKTVYKDRFPDHPYVEEISGLIEARNVKAGNRYPDFNVTREDGSTERISSLIKGNVAVIYNPQNEAYQNETSLHK